MDLVVVLLVRSPELFCRYVALFTPLLPFHSQTLFLGDHRPNVLEKLGEKFSSLQGKCTTERADYAMFDS